MLVSIASVHAKSLLTRIRRPIPLMIALFLMRVTVSLRAPFASNCTLTCFTGAL
jgi:hypothetical protein